MCSCITKKRNLFSSCRKKKLHFYNAYFYKDLDEYGNEISGWVDSWYAAYNAQEIELGRRRIRDDGHGNLYVDLLPIDAVPLIPIVFGQSHHAQTRADAWIWEKEHA